MATEFISNSWLMPTNANAEANRVSNYSLDFDGSSQLIDTGLTPLQLGLPSTTVTDSDFSISFWYYFDATQNYDPILQASVSATNGFGVWQSTTNTSSLNFWVGHYNSASLYTTELTSGNWYNIICVFDGGSTHTQKIYVDGVLNNSVSYTTSRVLHSGQSCLIGGQTFNNRYFNGKLTEVSFYDYSLSASQVTELYGTGSAIGNPMAITNGRKPVAYYPLGNSAFNGEFLVPNGAEQDYVFDFDGSNDYINCGNVLDQSGTDAFSVSGWVKYDTTKSNTLIGKMNSSFVGYQIYINAANKLKFLLQGTGNLSATGATALSTNTWYHIVVTYDGTGATTGINFYINGTSETFTGSGSNSGGVSNSENFEIGARTGTTDALDGLLSNVSIFNTALPATGTESVESLYNYGTPPNIASYSNLQAWYELDASATFDGSNWSIPDASSNSNTGTSSGMTAANLILSDLIINQSYDPFSLSFDGTDDYFTIAATSTLQITGDLSFSCWFKSSDSSIQFMINLPGGNGTRMWLSSNEVRVSQDVGGAYRQVESGGTYTDGNWHLATGVMNTTSGFMGIYIDGVLKDSRTDATGTRTTANSANFIGSQNATPTYPFNGSISNCSIYNSALTSAQVTTLYNEGKPFDLNNFEVTPVSWWRLGAVNSSFDGSNWTVLDEISTSGNNGVSANMTQSDLVDGVGATGSGTSSGMSSGTNRSDAPYSSNNAVSYNMSVTAKSTSVPT